MSLETTLTLAIAAAIVLTVLVARLIVLVLFRLARLVIRATYGPEAPHPTAEPIRLETRRPKRRRLRRAVRGMGVGTVAVYRGARRALAGTRAWVVATFRRRIDELARILSGLPVEASRNGADERSATGTLSLIESNAREERLASIR